MSRKLQHITTQDRATTAAIEGKKVKTLCGKRVYQMANMKDSIPTCTPCARSQQDAYNDLAATSSPWTYTYSLSASNGCSGDVA